MKKKQFFSGVLALMMLAGCANTQGQTPEVRTPINQAILLEKASQEQEDFTLPERFTGNWTSQEGKLKIHADALVETEQGVVLPTATVTPREFTQEDVDNLLRVFLKGAPLYDNVQTKAELKKGLERILSPEWRGDPDAPIQTEEEREAHRQEVIAWYEAEIEKAPEESQVIHGFSDSKDQKRISGTALVDGRKLSVFINQDSEWRMAFIKRADFNWGDPEPNGEKRNYPDKQEAIAQADALVKELGLDNMACDDVQLCSNGILKMYYVPTVNGVRLPSIRIDSNEKVGGAFFQYWDYGASEEKNPDTVSWCMENIQICIGKDGVYSFDWRSPSGTLNVEETQSAMLPFDKIAAIADTMLPAVIIGPTEAHSLVDLDRINGDESRMDVEITKVSLSLMRIRDKGSLQGTIVPVWDFWGTWTWYDADKQPENYTTQPMLTLNAIDGSVVSRLFGY